MSRFSEPLWTTPLRRWGQFEPLHKSTSTEENGSGCAAQQVGGSLAVYRRKGPGERAPLASTCVASRYLRETAERAPLASTCVASCSPVMQLGFVARCVPQCPRDGVRALALTLSPTD
jgi:hypothetical protein